MLEVKRTLFNMYDIEVFNSLRTLSQSNEVLQQRLAVLGERRDLHELK